jgi:hypothetical protein
MEHQAGEGVDDLEGLVACKDGEEKDEMVGLV